MNNETLLKLWIWNYKRYVYMLGNLAKRVNSTFLLEKLHDIETIRRVDIITFGAGREVVFRQHIDLIREKVIPELERLCDKFEISREGMNEAFLNKIDQFEKLENLKQAVAEYEQYSFDKLDGLHGQKSDDFMENRLWLAFNNIIPQK